jgi:hypothetical protein
VAPNNVDDSQLLAEALPNLTERTDLDTLVTDGGFGGEASDSALQEHGVTLIQTALRGAPPDPNKFSLADFSIQQDEQDQPTTLTCPQGQTVSVTRARTTGWQALCWLPLLSARPLASTGLSDHIFRATWNANPSDLVWDNMLLDATTRSKSTPELA